MSTINSTKNYATGFKKIMLTGGLEIVTCS